MARLPLRPEPSRDPCAQAFTLAQVPPPRADVGSASTSAIGVSLPSAHVSPLTAARSIAPEQCYSVHRERAYRAP